MTGRRQWDVLLIGGASGVGKSSVSYPVARHFGVGLTQIDDFQVVLERMTTPEQYPAIHFFPTSPDAFFAMDDDQKLALAIEYATTMAEPLKYVIANHLAGEPAIVLEGDWVLPTLCVQDQFDGIPAEGRVRAVFIIEGEEQIAHNYALREGGDIDPHRERAHSSARYGAWLQQEAARLGLPAVAARPWDTVVARVLACLEADDEPGTTTG